MRTKLFILCIFLLMTAFLAFYACGTEPADESSAVSAAESSDASGPDGESDPDESSSESDASDIIPSASSDASDESGEVSDESGEVSDESSDTSDESGGETSEETDTVREYLETQIDGPFEIWEKTEPIVVTVENPRTEEESWRLWWGEECLYTLGEDTWIYSVQTRKGRTVVTIAADGGKATITDGDGKKSEFGMSRTSAMLDEEGEVIVPFGEYTEMQLDKSFPTSLVYSEIKEGEAYILDGDGERLSEKLESAAVCRDGGFDVIVNGEKCRMALSDDGELEKMPAHSDGDSALRNEGCLDALKPFLNAIKASDSEEIIKVVGREKYDEAAALIDTLEEGYEPALDYYETPLEEQDTSKYLAWMLKNGKYIQLPLSLSYLEEVSFDEEPKIKASVTMDGMTDMFYATAWFSENTDGSYTLTDFSVDIMSIANVS